MRSYVATVTSQGQVTIPIEIRRKLGLKNRDKITFLVDDDRVEVMPNRFTLDTVFGSVEPLENQSANFGREIEEAMEDRADEIVGQMPNQ